MEQQRPPSRSSPELPAVLPPRLALNPQRAPPRSARGIGSMRSLSPALQVMQRSMLNPGPDVPKVPDAPRGERPRDYLAALSGARDRTRDYLTEAAVLLDCNLPGSPRRRASPELLPPRASSPRPGSARGRRPASPAENLKLPNARRCGTDTPEISSDVHQDKQRKAPLSARTRRTPSDLAVDAQPAPQSARTSGQRPSSAKQLYSWDESTNLGNMWPKERRRIVMVETNPEDVLQRSAKMLNGGTRSRSVSRDPDMDALDGLLASLDEEREHKEDVPQGLPSSPVVKSRNALERSPRRKRGMSDVWTKNGNVWTSAYDEEVVAMSPQHLLQEADESQKSASIYCPLSPTIMSVHLPGSPTPQAAKVTQAPKFDDTVSSLVLLGEPKIHYQKDLRPGKVRFECRGATDARQHAPEAPRRRPNGTGKFTSRPLGCTLVANLGGA